MAGNMAAAYLSLLGASAALALKLVNGCKWVWAVSDWTILVLS